MIYMQTATRRRKLTDKTATLLVYACMILALIPLLWVLSTLITKGLGTLIDPSWWTSSQRGVLYSRPGGGALHAMVGTLVQIAICSLISIPIGVLTAVYLVEYANGNRLGRITTFMVDILTGVPSIVAALFVYSMWIVMFGFGRSGFAVALALVILMIPVIIRNTEEMLRVVPMDLREAAYALGIPRWKTITRVVFAHCFVRDSHGGDAGYRPSDGGVCTRAYFGGVYPGDQLEFNRGTTIFLTTDDAGYV